MKIDQIAATENGLSNKLGATIKDDDDSNWITKLYRQFNDPISTDAMSANETASTFGYDYCSSNMFTKFCITTFKLIIYSYSLHDVYIFQ